MMRSVMYGDSKSKDLEKYCAYQKCQKNVLYNKINTSTNNVSVTCRMKHAQYIKSVSNVGKCTKILDPAGNVVGQFTS